MSITEDMLEEAIHTEDPDLKKIQIMYSTTNFAPAYRYLHEETSAELIELVQRNNDKWHISEIDNIESLKNAIINGVNFMEDDIDKLFECDNHTYTGNNDGIVNIDEEYTLCLYKHDLLTGQLALKYLKQFQQFHGPNAHKFTTYKLLATIVSIELGETND
jgi:hypothetical protein